MLKHKYFTEWKLNDKKNTWISSPMDESWGLLEFPLYFCVNFIAIQITRDVTYQVFTPVQELCYTFYAHYFISLQLFYKEWLSSFTFFSFQN